MRFRHQGKKPVPTAGDGELAREGVHADVDGEHRAVTCGVIRRLGHEVVTTERAITTPKKKGRRKKISLLPEKEMHKKLELQHFSFE